MQPSRSARQKRGVSEIVATVLIIMIVVAAVGILWASVSPMIKNSLGSSDCSKADVSIVADSVYTCYEPNNITIIQIKKGTSTTNVSKLIFYLSSGGNMVKYTREVSLSGAGLSVYAFNSSKISKVDRIGVVPVVGKKECSAVYAEEVFACKAAEVLPVLPPTIDDSCVTETCVGKCGTVGECSCGGCPTRECKTATCGVGGTCEYSNLMQGTSCNSDAGTCNSAGTCVSFSGRGWVSSTWVGLGSYGYVDRYFATWIVNGDWSGMYVRFSNASNSECIADNTACSRIEYVVVPMPEYGLTGCWYSNQPCMEISDDLLTPGSNNQPPNNLYGRSCMGDSFYVYSDLNSCNNALA